MKDLLNIIECNGKWHKLGEDLNCEKFTMSDLKELLMKERKETLEYAIDEFLTNPNYELCFLSGDKKRKIAKDILDKL